MLVCIMDEDRQPLNLPAASVSCHLSNESPAAATCIKPTLDEESPQLLPGQPPAGGGDPTMAVSTEQVGLLRFCKQEYNNTVRGTSDV